MTRRPADTNANADGGAGKAPQLRPSGLDRSADGGATWERTNSNNVRPFYYSQVRLDPKDPNRVYWSSTPVNFSNDGGKTVGNATVGIHVDHHAMWIDPNDPNHIVVGNDGGVAQSWDKGGNWDFLNSFAIGQPYIVSYDMNFPYGVCAGYQNNGSWCGPSPRRQPDGTFILYSGTPRARSVPVKAVKPDGTPYPFPSLVVDRVGNSYRFMPSGEQLVVKLGGFRRQDFWLFDVTTGQHRRLTRLRPGDSLQRFDVSPEGKGLMFERVRENSDVVLIELPRPVASR